MVDKNEMAAVREILAPKEEVTEEVTDELVEVEAEAVVAAVAEEPEAVLEEAAEEEGDGSPDEPVEEKYSVASLADAIGWEAADLYAVEVSMGDGERR